MRTAGDVDGASETASPGRIMHTVIAVKRHPVVYMGRIVRSSKHRIPRLVGQTENALRSDTVRSGAQRPGYEVRFKGQFPILINIHMLIRQVCLHVGGADIIGALLLRSNTVDRFSFDCTSGIDQLKQFIRLRVSVCLPSVVFSRQRQFNSQRCHEFLRLAVGVIL